jgi:CheY-like chemotaxis protein
MLSPVAAVSPRLQPSAPLARAVRVLLVEDDRDLREALDEFLHVEGFETLVAGNGLEALLLLRSSAALPDVILLDVDMPVMDGREFRDAQRRDPVAGHVPVVVLSSAIPEGLGAEANLEKPCRPEVLTRILRAVAARAPRA